MINKISEEWDKATQPFRRGQEEEPVELKEVLHAVKGVREVLRSMCQVSVTRTSLRNAVREALGPLVEAQVQALLPEVFREIAELRSRLDGAGAGVAAPLSSDAPPSPFSAEMREQLERFEERIRRIAELETEIQSSFEECHGRVDAVDSKVEDVDGRLRLVDARLGDVSARLEAVDARFAGFEGRLDEIRDGVGEVNYRVADVDSRLGETDAGMRDARVSLLAGMRALEEVIAEAETRRRAEAEDGRVAEALRRQDEARIRASLASLEAGMEKANEFARSLEALLAEVKASVPGAIERSLETLESRLREDFESGASGLADSVSRLRESFQLLVAEAEARGAAEIAALRAETEGRLGVGLERAEEGAARVREDLVELLAMVEASVPLTAAKKADEVGARARKDVDDAVKALLERVAEVRGSLEAELRSMEERSRAEAARLEAEAGERLRRGVAGVEETIDRVRGDLSLLLAGVEASIAPAVNGKAGEVESALRREIDRTAEDLAGKLCEMRNDVQVFAGQLEERQASELAAVRGRLGEVREQLLGSLARLEASVPETVERRTGELEAQLRKEIEDMVQSLTGKLSELKEILGRVETKLPRREALESVDERLARMEDRFAKVSSQVESLHSAAPELQALGERFSAVRSEIAALAGGLTETGKGVGALEGSLRRGMEELQLLVDSGIQRWESDQSQTLERLGAIRDTLRDQLRSVADHVEAAQGGLLAKLTGKGDGGLKLSRDDWDHLSTKIEGIIGGLESILAKKQKR